MVCIVDPRTPAEHAYIWRLKAQAAYEADPDAFLAEHGPGWIEPTDAADLAAMRLVRVRRDDDPEPFPPAPGMRPAYAEAA